MRSPGEDGGGAEAGDRRGLLAARNAERGAGQLERRHAALIPPSTRKVDAVTNDASSLARNVTVAAISSASAKRPIGTCTRRRAARSGSLAKSSCNMDV